jgi:large subunit ribosomal protein L18
MIKQIDKKKSRLKIKKRIRAKVSGTADTPRLSIYKSNKHIYGQLIDDVTAITLVAASTKTATITSQLSDAKGIEKATVVGKYLAEIAKEKGIERVKFDRNGFRYHGQVKAFADAAREAGLKF